MRAEQKGEGKIGVSETGSIEYGLAEVRFYEFRVVEIRSREIDRIEFRVGEVAAGKLTEAGFYIGAAQIEKAPIREKFAIHDA